MIKCGNTQKSAHPPLCQTCKVLHPWALFCETMVIFYWFFLGGNLRAQSWWNTLFYNRSPLAWLGTFSVSVNYNKPHVSFFIPYHCSQGYYIVTTKWATWTYISSMYHILGVKYQYCKYIVLVVYTIFIRMDAAPCLVATLELTPRLTVSASEGK